MIAQEFYPCMVHGPQPENADPSSLLWCRDDNLFKRNFQHAKASAKENKKSWGLDFNPGPSAPRNDDTREAEENEIGPFTNLDGLISYILVQGAKVDHSENDADTDEAPAPPPKSQKLKKIKASTSAAPPKASRAKPLATAPPEDSVQSEDLSRISKKTEKKKKIIKSTDQTLTPAAILREEHIDLSSDDDLADDALEQLIKSKEEAEIFNNFPLFDVAIIHNFIDEWFDTPNLSFDDLQLPIGLNVAFNGAIASELPIAQCIVELKHKIDYEKARFKKHVATLNVQDVKNLKIMLHELKEAFHKKREEARGSLSA